MKPDLPLTWVKQEASRPCSRLNPERQLAKLGTDPLITAQGRSRPAPATGPYTAHSVTGLPNHTRLLPTVPSSSTLWPGASEPSAAYASFASFKLRLWCSLSLWVCDLACMPCAQLLRYAISGILHMFSAGTSGWNLFPLRHAPAHAMVNGDMGQERYFGVTYRANSNYDTDWSLDSAIETIE